MDLRGLPLSRNVIDKRQGQSVAEIIGNVIAGGAKTMKQKVDAYMEGDNTLVKNPSVKGARRLAELLLRGK